MDAILDICTFYQKMDHTGCSKSGAASNQTEDLAHRKNKFKHKITTLGLQRFEKLGEDYREKTRGSKAQHLTSQYLPVAKPSLQSLQTTARFANAVQHIAVSHEMLGYSAHVSLPTRFGKLWTVVPKLVRAVTQIKAANMSHYPQYFAS